MTIKVNGKVYNDINKGVNAAIVSGIEKSVRQKLSHFNE